MSVSYSIRCLGARVPQGRVAVLELANPPLNALNQELRAQLLGGLARAAADPEISGVIIKGAGSAFSSGADINEFASGGASAAPQLPEVVDELEACAKPVVAALHGVAMGGGLEVAMGCHIRVAAPGARIALPEVKLGLLPGAGGTQRLPRLVGVKHALSLMTSGKTITSAEALSMGLVEEVLPEVRGPDAVHDQLLAAASSCIENVLLGDATVRRASEVPCPNSAHDARHTVIEAKQMLDPTGDAGGKEAALTICDMVLAAALHPYDVGKGVERSAFTKLGATSAACALQHAFFAERAVRNIPELQGSGAEMQQAVDGLLQNVGVIGAGTMGGGIAVALLRAGAAVTLVDARRESLDRGMAGIAAIFQRDVKRGRVSADAAKAALKRLTGTLDLGDLRSSALVIEAAFEDMEVKQGIFRRLGEVCRPNAILCSNTSTLDIDALASAAPGPERILGMHFFSPAHIMRLVEVVRGTATAPDVTGQVALLAKRLNKVGVVVGNCDGFVGNRMLYCYTSEAGLMLDEGLDPPAIDAPMKAFGFPMGPFTMGDLAGNDISWHIRKGKGEYNPAKNFADRLCDDGRYGQKAGKGWYRYDKAVGGGRIPLPDEELHQQLAAFRAEQPKVNRHGIYAAPEEVVDRCLLPLVNEGFRLLEEGIARTPSDIDVIYLFGYGFPNWRGGPMHWAAQKEGLASVVEKMAVYRRKFEPNSDVALRYRFDYRWTPCALLVEAAKAIPEPGSDDLGAFLREWQKGSRL